MNIEINLAKEEDAESIQKLHRASVRTNAGAFYSTEIIEAWAKPNTKEVIEKIKNAIEDPKALLAVARLDEKVLGFGSVVPEENELRAVYIDPQYGRLGIGTKILQFLENIAVEHNVKKLRLSASLNAEDFYTKNGYKVVDHSFHTLRTGMKMKCVNMEKLLDGAQTSLNKA